MRSRKGRVESAVDVVGLDICIGLFLVLRCVRWIPCDFTPPVRILCLGRMLALCIAGVQALGSRRYIVWGNKRVSSS